MNNLNIGDKVRLKSGSEEGFVVGFIDVDTLEVEIVDGFRLPFRKSDLVLVSRDEDYFFRKAAIETPEKKRAEIYAEKGLSWAFVPYNDYLFDLVFINNTDLQVALSAGEDDGQIVKGLICKVIEKRSFVKVAQYNWQKFEKWPALYTQVLYFYERIQTPRPPLVSKLRFKAESFLKAKTKAPQLNTTAHLFSIDSNQPIHENKIEIPQPQTLKQAMLSPKIEEQKIDTPIIKVPSSREIDLHIEKIISNPEKTDKKLYLDIQIKTFEQELDRAIVEGVDEIVFIHGTGNGILKNEVQKRLSKHPNVAFFQDAKREKFGFGATMAKLK